MRVKEKMSVFGYQSGKSQGILVHVLGMNPVYQGCPTFFLGGPHSNLGHRRRATYQWRSQRRIFKGSKSGCVRGDRRVWNLEGNYAVN